jgi:exosortase A-associated hydrolase 2
MRRPQASAGVSVLIVPPFAEEMNKTRRMLTEVGQALQVRGVATTLVDPYGTGDSEGEFRDATWACWIQDFARAASWAAEEGWPIDGLLCVRLGCLLGAQLAQEVLGGVQSSIFWQPVVDGDRFLTQFLRIRVAASMMGAERESVSELRQTLRTGHCLEVAGYELSSKLAMELEGLKLADHLGAHLGVLHWMEVSREVQGPVGATSETCLELARSRRLQTMVRTVTGEPFWASTEIVRTPELVESTVEVLAGMAARLKSREHWHFTGVRQ